MAHGEIWSGYFRAAPGNLRCLEGQALAHRGLGREM